MFPRALAIALLAATTLLPSPALAKRSPPAPVAPVDVGDVRLVVRHSGNACGQIGGCVEVIDRATGKLRRAVTVYKVVVDPDLERDVQDTYIRSLEVEGKTVRVRDEGGRVFSFTL